MSTLKVVNLQNAASGVVNLTLNANGTSTFGGVVTFDPAQVFADPTLQQVTTTGNVTTNTIDVGGLIAAGLTYPTADGLANQVLTTDGAGNLGWAFDSNFLTQVAIGGGEVLLTPTTVNTGFAALDAGGTRSAEIQPDGSAIVANLTAAGLTYPIADGAAGDLLTTDGLGTLSWLTPVTPDLQAVTTAGAVTTDTVDVGGLIAAGLIYPAADGAAGELLTTDGAGNLGWTSSGSDLQQVTDAGAVTTNSITTAGLVCQGDLDLPFATGQVRFYESSGTSATIFKAPATVPADVTFTVPSVDGANGDVLSTDGAGDLSWITTAKVVATPPSSGAGGADNEISFDAAGNFYFYKGGQWWKVAGVAF